MPAKDKARRNIVARRYYANHRAERQAYNRAYRASKRDEINARRRELVARPEAKARVAAQRRARRQVPSHRAKAAAWNRAWALKQFGLTPEVYEARLVEQGGRCAICRRPPAAGKRLVVDHDHQTGMTRELLCNNCNTVLGMTQEDPALMERVAQYAMKWKEKADAA